VKYVNDNPANGIAFTRPMCPYPQQARYQGFGSTTDAAIDPGGQGTGGGQ